MNYENETAITICLLIFLFVGCVYVHLSQNHMTMNGKKYVKVGMMEINDNGTKLYTPVYKEK